jgi:hypothetical protein
VGTEDTPICLTRTMAFSQSGNFTGWRSRTSWICSFLLLELGKSESAETKIDSELNTVASRNALHSDIVRMAVEGKNETIWADRECMALVSS